MTGCVGTSSTGVFGTGVSIALDPRTIGTQIDDSIMQKNLTAKLLNMDKNNFLSVKSKVLDGRIFITGKVNSVEDKFKITKLAWEIKGVREVVNELQVSDSTSIKDIAKDLAASATLRGKLIADSEISSLNFSIDVVNGTVYLSGVASSSTEMNKVISHAERLRFVQEVVNYIILTKDQRY